MSALAVAAILFVCVFGGALLGMLLRTKLPKHHLEDESKDVVKLGMGLVATMAALVLGLLVASAKSSYDSQKNGLDQMSASLVILDSALRFPEAVVQSSEYSTAIRRQLARCLGFPGSARPELSGPCRGRNIYGAFGAWPSGKAQVFGTCIRRFESFRPSLG